MWTKEPDLVPNRVWIHRDSKTLRYNEINSLRPREGSPAVAFPPPIHPNLSLIFNKLTALGRQKSPTTSPTSIVLREDCGRRNRVRQGAQTCLPASVDHDMSYDEPPLTAGCSRSRCSSRSIHQSKTCSTETAPSPAGTISRPVAPPLSRSGVNSALPDTERVWANRGCFAFV